MFHVIRHLFHEFLFAYLSFLPNTDVIMTLLPYFVCRSFLSVTKINVWHTIEQRIIWRIHWPVAFTSQNTHMCRMWTF